MFGILTNQDFYTFLVDVKNEKDSSVLEGVPYFPLLACPLALLYTLILPSSSCFNTCHTGFWCYWNCDRTRAWQSVMPNKLLQCLIDQNSKTQCFKFIFYQLHHFENCLKTLPLDKEGETLRWGKLGITAIKHRIWEKFQEFLLIFDIKKVKTEKRLALSTLLCFLVAEKS